MSEKKIRVLHLFKTYLPDSYGGIEQVINQIARGASVHGIKSTVLTLSDNPAPEKLNINGHEVWRCKLDFKIASTGFSFEVFRKFKELVEQADIIHYQFPWPLMDIMHFTASVKKPTIVSYQSDVVRQKMLMHFYRPLQNKFLSHVDKIIASSPSYINTSEVLQQYTEKVSVIPIGLDKETYPKPSQNIIENWRQKFGEKFFLFVGVLRYYKGLEFLIEAARSTNISIVIAGAGPIESILKAQVARYALSNVHFTGQISDEDKVALLTLCFAFVFPSHLRSEAFGISLLEGAMYGKPLISCEIGTGTTYINIDQLTGLVVPPADANALRKAMSWLWAHPKEAAQMGNRAAKRYQELFTADDMVKKYVNLYEEITNS